MTPKVKSPTLSVSGSSPELGSATIKTTQYNKQTGRPIRKSAGKMKQAAFWVDSGIINDVDSESMTSDESEDEEGLDNRSHMDRMKRKRKRSPTPPSPSLGPVIYNQELGELTDDETSGAFHRKTPKQPPITLQFNVPLGFHGPLFVKLDSAILKVNDEGSLHDMHKLLAKKPRIPTSKEAGPVVRSRTFADLPPEMRNSVYRHLFACERDETLRIPQLASSSGLHRSSQFLRTCKLVHNEGCSILYGENEFDLRRHHDTRVPFWEPIPKEIGYQDVLQFLRMIGPENIQYLRDIKIDFDDALPRYTPDMNSESRRYITDDYLMHCLRILRDAKLRRVSLHFGGRRQLFKSDVKFLGYLEQIKADEVVKTTPHWSQMAKVSNWVWLDVKEQMTRKKKLYEN
ncbi:hypothetical protein GQ44DRAFT_610593 [Phaeosphaeriaceae sp. PMI808]|nr:hypothetical protein GQ44DRAFT_610593 [Phaeosphaeriaceae sp. PMI808]